MAANRRKTIEYTFAPRLTPLTTGVTPAAAGRHDTPALTLFIPEVVSRSFLSVRLVATYRTEYATTNGITGWRMGIKLGSAATSDTDRTFTAVNTASKNLFDVVDLDVTGYFNTNFGSAGSQTCIASLAVATTTASNINGITLKLVITYEFDAAAQTTRIKTIRIPIQSQSGALTAAQQELGTDGTTAAPANQIPALDTFLPESGKVYRQIFLESTGNDVNATGNTAFTPFVQIDAATETARATIDEVLATPLVWRDVVDLTSAIATTSAHALKMRCDLTARLAFASSTLVVTYEYNASASTTIMCEALVPLTMSNDDGVGIGQGESFSNNVIADAQALIAALSIQETNPVLVQSAVYLTCVSYTTGSVVNVRAGAQVFRPYNPGAVAVGDLPIIHRVDHSSGWTLVRGDNRLVLNVFNASTARSDATGHALINYTATAPSDPDAATHAVNYATCSYGQTLATAIDISAGGDQRVPKLGTPYRIQAVFAEQYYHISENQLFNQLLLEQRTGEWDAAGFIATPYRHCGLAQVGSWRIAWPLTRAFNTDHLHTGKLNIETARRQVASSSGFSGQASWSWWITYHQLSFTVAGAVTVGLSPVPNGKTVEIYARDARNNVELVTTATTASGTGAFSAAVVDSTRTYFASYQDGITRGRSADGTPGTAFNVAIPGGVTALPVASATDPRARILPSGAVEIAWSYPDDIAAQGIVFDVYQSDDPGDTFRTAAATSVAALVVVLSGQGLVGEHTFAIVARRGPVLALPSRTVILVVPAPRPAAAPATAVSAVRAQEATGVGFPFGIAPAGGVFVQGGDALLRGRILQLLLTSPGERVNRPDFGTRLLDLVFDPNSEVLAATMEFTITRALQQEFADEIQLDAVQLTSDDNTLLVDISYVRRADLTRDQLRVGVPLPPGATP